MLTAIQVTLVSSTVQVGQLTTARAIGLDQNGASLDLSGVTWSSANTAVATVSPSGQIAALAPGQVQITAGSGAKSGQAILTVTPVPVAAVTVTPPTELILVGFAPLQLTATTRDANGGVLTGRAVAWTTSNANTATVSASGLVTAVASGAVTITATSEGKNGSAEIQVVFLPVATVDLTPPTLTMNMGSTQQLTARPLSNTGQPLPGRVVTWSSSDVTKATVNASGLVTAVAAGSATITAACEGVSQSAQITVVLAPNAIKARSY